MKGLLRASAALLIGVFLLVAGLLVYLQRGSGGFSARADPGRAETLLARYARDAAMPAAARQMRNPVPLTSEAIHDGLAHYADHCAVCHGNSGDGNTMLGSGMYPKPPDLRAQTQRLSDGAIFYMIENGVRMSGMPAFGTPGTEVDSWKLVHFIRHLPVLTAKEQAEMEHLNPKGPDEIREEQDEEQFLKGGSDSVTPAPQHTAKGHTS